MASEPRERSAPAPFDLAQGVVSASNHEAARERSPDVEIQDSNVLNPIQDTTGYFTNLTLLRASMASEPRERSAPAKRRARERVRESEGRKPLG
jgi:hypothetical protein